MPSKTTEKCDILVIGSGPGGYPAAFRTAKNGKKTILVELEELGGTCLNWGCIPTKALLDKAHFIKKIREYSMKNLISGCSNAQISTVDLLSYTKDIQKKLRSGIASKAKSLGVRVVKGRAKLKSSNEAEIYDAENSLLLKVSFSKVILATGSVPRNIPGIEVNSKNIWTSHDALVATDIPKSIAILGSGPIGIEFADFYSSLGAKVTIIEGMNQIMPLADEDISREIVKAVSKNNISCRVGFFVNKIQQTKNSIILSVGSDEIKVEKLLLATGVTGNLNSAGEIDLGVKTKSGFIETNDNFETTIPNIYAVGDLIGGLCLAHKATREGEICADLVCGNFSRSRKDINLIPSCIYSSPQIAFIGMSQQEAEASGRSIATGKAYYMANGKASAVGCDDIGFFKIIVDKKTGEILGASGIGEDVSETIHACATIIKAEGTIRELCETIFAHPTLSEVVSEAATNAADAIQKN